jgi:acyl-coenzyme A thioesterase PaaI-like protein
MNVQVLDQMVAQGVPFNRLLGIQAVSAEPERVELQLPAKPEHQNHVGTVHAAAQYALGEAASGAMMLTAFGNLLAEGIIPLATQASIKYRAPGEGDLKGVATLAEAVQTETKEKLAQSGKVRFSVEVQMLNHADKVVSEMTIEWILLKRS